MASPDRYTAAIEEHSSLMRDQQPLFTVETHCHMLQTAQKNYGGDEKVKGAVESI